MDISAEIAAIQAASQGSELRQPLVGALNKLNSGSLPAVTSSDAGKILKVGANGWEVGEKSGYMPVPVAEKQIIENGTYDVINYASVDVDVPGIIPTGTLQISSNNTYDVTNYASAEVNVPNSAILQSKTVTPSASQQTIIPDSGYNGLSSVIVNGDADLVAENIKNGVEIFGITGKYEGEGAALNNYVESSASTYINTGYVIKSNSQLEIVAKYSADDFSSDYISLFGAQNRTSPYAATQFSPKWGTASVYRVGFGGQATTANWDTFNNKKSEFAISYAHVYAIEFNQIQRNYKIPGTIPYTSVTFSGGSDFAQFPTYLFGLNNGGSIAGCFKFKCYRFRIWESDTLVMNLLPWVDNNNVVCMKDTVTDNLFYNAGTGSFTFGTDS